MESFDRMRAEKLHLNAENQEAIVLSKMIAKNRPAKPLGLQDGFREYPPLKTGGNIQS